MDNSKEPEEIRQILTNVHDMNVEQLKVMKKQLNLVFLTSVILVIALAVLIFYIGTTFARISDTLDDIQAVTIHLADADWPGMIENINTLVGTSQESVSVATEKIKSIDIEALNQSIHDLNSIIEPLARLFGAR